MSQYQTLPSMSALKATSVWLDQPNQQPVLQEPISPTLARTTVLTVQLASTVSVLLYLTPSPVPDITTVLWVSSWICFLDTSINVVKCIISYAMKDDTKEQLK